MTPAIEQVHAIQSAAIKRFWKNHYEGPLMTPAIEKAKVALRVFARAYDELKKLRLNGSDVRSYTVADTDLSQAYDALVGLIFESPKLPALGFAGAGERVRHKKRGTTYTVMSRDVRVQTDTPLRDDDRVVVYIGDDGHWNVRPPSEFDDGRFEPLPQPPRAGDA